MAHGTPWLSVLMPVYNGAAYLGQALDSIVREADPGIECIVVDGGSDDGTAALAAGHANRLALEVIERKDSPNWVWSTNHALARARAAHCTILHQDDYWLAGRAGIVREMIGRAPQAGLLAHDAVFVSETGRRLGRLSCPWPALPATVDSQRALRHLLVQNFLSCPAPVFSTALARQAGGMDDTLWYTADWDFWLKLARAAPVAYEPRPLAAFRIHPLSQTVRRSRNAAAFREQLDRVAGRHAAGIASPALRRRVLAAAHFSNALNAALAARLHGQRLRWLALAGRALALGPGDLRRYVRDSRILSRGLARARAGLGARRPEWA